MTSVKTYVIEGGIAKMSVKIVHAPVKKLESLFSKKDSRKSEGIYRWVFASVDDSDDEDSNYRERIRARNTENQMHHMNNSMGNMTVTSNHHSTNNQTAPAMNGSSYPITTTHHIDIKRSGKSKKGKNDKKAKLRKEDIGTPTDFRHVQHVGWDANKGYDVAVKDPYFKQFFEKAGVHIDQEDEETQEFIYRFIESHGGLDAVKNDVANDLSSTGRPPAPDPTGWPREEHPPPLPQRGHGSSTGMSKPSAPPPPARPAPPKMNPVPPQPPMRNYPTAPKVPPPPGPRIPVSTSSEQSNGFVPPPPPPPPPPGFSIPPPPPLIPPSVGSSYGDESDHSSTEMNPSSGRGQTAGGGDRSELWQQIQKGVALKPVNQDGTPRKSVDPKSELMDQIRTGTVLKPVVRDETPKLVKTGGLAGALLEALEKRRDAFNSDEDSDEDKDDNDDDEWDD